MYEEEEMVQALRPDVRLRTNRSFKTIEQHSNPTPSPPLFFCTNSSSSEATSSNSSRPESSLSATTQQATQAMHFAMDESVSSSVPNTTTTDSFQFSKPKIRHTVSTDAADMSDIVNVLLPSNDTDDCPDSVPSIVLGYRRDLELERIEKQRRRLERQQARKSANATRLMNKAAKPAQEEQAATEINELIKLNRRLAHRWAIEMSVSHFLDGLLSKMDRPYMENVSESEDDDDEMEPQYGDEGVESMASGEYMVECQLDTSED